MRTLALIVLLLFLPLSVKADGIPEKLLEEAGLSRLEAIADEYDGPDLRTVAQRVISGEWEIDGELTAKALRYAVTQLRQALLQALSALAAPLLMGFVLRAALGRADGALTLLSRLAGVCVLARQSACAMAVAETTMRTMARIADRVSPIVAAALTLTGRAATAAKLTPLSTLCVNLIENELIHLGMPLCVTACAIAAGATLSDQFRLDRLFDLVCGVTKWGLRMITAAFIGLLTLEGRLAASRDAVSWQAVQQALKGLIPFVGGSISDSSVAMRETAIAVRGTIGVAGMLICVWVAAKPLLQLGTHLLSLKLAAAVCEPMAEPGITHIVADYSEISGLLLAMCACSVMIVVLLAGTCLAFSGL